MRAKSRNNDLDDDENESFLLLKKLVVPNADEATPSKEETVTVVANNTAGVENFMFGLNDVKNVVVDVGR